MGVLALNETRKVVYMKAVLRGMTGALVATCALAVLASASASAALPEFRGGTPTFTGSGGTVTIEEVLEGGETGKYTCTSSSISGQIVGSKEVAKVTAKFMCASFCHNTEGVWEAKELKGRIAYISKASKTVGLLLEPVTQPITECSHGATSAKIKGSIIGAIGPVNMSQTGFNLTYQQTKGIQGLRHFEGEETLHNLEILPAGFPLARSFGLGSAMSLTTQKAIEIEA
jgi:hypothetical protein